MEYDSERDLYSQLKEAGVLWDDLEGTVSECARAKADSINKEGLFAQVDFLEEEGEPEEIFDTAIASRDDRLREQAQDEKRGLYPEKQDIAN